MSSNPLSWDGGRLEGTAWQGIRYLELDLPTSGAYKAVVTAHLNQPVGALSADNVTVTGGRARTDLPYDVTLSGSDVVVSFTSFGDHSDYQINLVQGGNSTLRIHPFFASASFRFTIGCEGGDCEDSGEQASATPAQRPTVDLLTKDFNGFVRVLTDWVKVRNPHWADLSPASFERVIVDLLAWQGDMLSYYQDRVANEAFIDTASQRHSLRQHAALLGTSLFDGAAATTTLSFDVSSSGFVPLGLQVRVKGREESPVVFTLTSRGRVRTENNSAALALAAWPEATDAAVPAGATEALLWGQSVDLVAGDRLAFVQGAFSQVVTLTEVRQESVAGWVSSPDQAFDVSLDPPAALTRITWSEALRAALYPWRDPEIPLRIHANLVDAVHGQRKTAWVSAAGSGAGRRDVVMDLNRRNSIVARVNRGDTAVYLLRALQVPEKPVLFDADGESSVPAFDLVVDGETWSRQEHLHNSKSYDLHYVASADEDGSLWIQVGDGTAGHEIEVERDAETGASRPLSTIELRYRLGDPIAGNTALDTLTEIVKPVTGSDEEAALSGLGYPSGVTVTNVLPGTGGRQPQPRAAAREAIPASLRHGDLERAVSLSDYAEVAMQVDGVARATARALGGVFNTVLVLVDPSEGDALSDEVKAEVEAHLERRRMAGREVRVMGPEYVPLEVELIVCVKTGFLRHKVRDRVLAELRPGTSDRQGWFHPDRLSFGDQVRLGDLLAVVAAIPGVKTAKAVTFRKRVDVNGASVTPILRFGVTEVPRMDADPDYPEHGSLSVRVVGLDADESDFLVARSAS